MSGSRAIQYISRRAALPASAWQSQFRNDILQSNSRLHPVNMKAPRLSTLAMLVAEFTSDAGDSPEDSPWPRSNQAILAGIEEEKTSACSLCARVPRLALATYRASDLLR
jgi:hypothetical protein